MEDKSPFMVVKIRFGRGSVVARRKGKNSRLAFLGATLLTLVSICLASLGIWRFCQDVGLAGDFVFPDGFLSHWQVWIGSAAAAQYACWRLTSYARPDNDISDATEEEEDSEETARLAANV